MKYPTSLIVVLSVLLVACGGGGGGSSISSFNLPSPSTPADVSGSWRVAPVSSTVITGTNPYGIFYLSQTGTSVRSLRGALGGSPCPTNPMAITATGIVSGNSVTLTIP
jgi:hypothetical protein